MRTVARRLSARYGDPRLGNKSQALDELVFILLSAKTAEPSYLRTYAGLHAAFPNWFAILDVPRDRVRAVLRPGGLAKKKERQLRSVLQRLRNDGIVDLGAHLALMGDGAAEQFLESLPGLGRKSSRCILMYACGREVLPVDTHVARVFSRLGWFPRRRLTDAVQDSIQRIVPKGLRYGLHVNVVAHGRATCLARAPRCESCTIRRWCAYYRAASTEVERTRPTTRRRRNWGRTGRPARTSPPAP